MSDQPRAAGIESREDAMDAGEDVVRRCPDDGRCWHDCGEGSCFRVVLCLPFEDHGEDWSDEEKANNRPEGLRPSIESAVVTDD